MNKTWVKIGELLKQKMVQKFRKTNPNTDNKDARKLNPKHRNMG